MVTSRNNITLGKKISLASSNDNLHRHTPLHRRRSPVSLWQIYFCLSFSMRVHVNCSSLFSIETIESNRSTDPDRSIARKQIQRTHGLRKKTCFIHTILAERLTVIANVITIGRSFDRLSTIKNCSYR